MVVVVVVVVVVWCDGADVLGNVSIYCPETERQARQR